MYQPNWQRLPQIQPKYYFQVFHPWDLLCHEHPRLPHPFPLNIYIPLQLKDVYELFSELFRRKMVRIYSNLHCSQNMLEGSAYPQVLVSQNLVDFELLVRSYSVFVCQGCRNLLSQSIFRKLTLIHGLDKFSNHHSKSLIFQERSITIWQGLKQKVLS